MSKHQASLEIKGRKWIIEYLTPQQYKRKHGLDSEGICLLHEKRIHLNKALISPGIVRHELIHALVEESNTESADLNANQMEELICAILQYHWAEFNAWTEYILFNAVKRG